MSTEIALVSAIFGMGNNNQDHVHRHNTLNIDSMNIDTLKMEQYHGGLTPSTLNKIAAQSGGISSRPQGYVNIEDGFNVRRGIGLLRFHISQNAIEQRELAVMGYLTGGGASVEGIEGQTLFVPVRSWTTSTKNVADNMGLPMASTMIASSTQFLQGDPFHQQSLKAIRPLDVGNEILGLMAVAAEDSDGNNYDGTLNADLSKHVVVSKTENLNPTHHARELLKIATATTSQAQYGTVCSSIADNLSGAGIGEMGITENEFFRTMMVGQGHHSLNGFQGFTVAEINNVFSNFLDVLNLQMLQTSNFAVVDNLLGSSEYGSSSSHEIIGSELAYMTVHLLIKCGLTHLDFSATNNIHDTGGLVGSDDGVEIVVGAFGSVLEHDDYAINRVEQFKQLLKAQFFSKYQTGYVHTSTIINVIVNCSVFGETVVEIFFNGDPSNRKNYVNATYCINRTSTNISGTEIGLAEARGFMQNIQEFFVN